MVTSHRLIDTVHRTGRAGRGEMSHLAPGPARRHREAVRPAQPQRKDVGARPRQVGEAQGRVNLSWAAVGNRPVRTRTRGGVTGTAREGLPIAASQDILGNSLWIASRPVGGERLAFSPSPSALRSPT